MTRPIRYEGRAIAEARRRVIRRQFEMSGRETSQLALLVFLACAGLAFAVAVIAWTPVVDEPVVAEASR
jgi:hypothetical protein